MDAQELRNLSEAYMEVYSSQEELDEGREGGRFEYNQRHGRPFITPEVSQSRSSQETLGGGTYVRGPKRLPKSKRKYDRQVLSGVRAASDQEKERARERMGIRENYDLYDIILSHLLDEGYAETPEAAEAIMANMSQEYEELDEGIRSAISRLFGKKPAAPQSRGEQLRAKHGSDIRGKRYERTQQLHGSKSSQAQQVSQAGASLRGIESRDETPTNRWRGGGHAAQRRAGRTPQPQTIGSNERASQFKGKAGQKPMNIRPSGPVFVRRDIQDMPLASQRAARGKKKPLATGSRLGEGYLYDMILEYLLDEGYAETQKAAEIILENMSDEWLDSIIG